eukprot:CAMPEP_0181203490 /NCGR_PEP_ID=MMETSP1096-20121128/19414_1 /TAXON_ID=156174 ORGANISM="Chrysochromulina ericina, Strain CCMP281" /NCGR_SAMPLE_ID=MMETSP1096 /ASSEMBLY_ACC=CAM_ASM_000453 /LENGTH=38 /DNA_ID= /DNA_START= /DNA_END= /DNA_ORIENTATION=
MTTLKLDLRYWPTYTLARSSDGEWSRFENLPPAADPQE